MPRLLIASNRLPVTVRAGGDGEVTVAPSSGGLATGMKGPHAEMGGEWIGWPGDLSGVTDEARREVDRRLAELRLVPVELSSDEITRYYERYSNGVLWPLFHYFAARLPYEISDFDVYERVNARFADAVAARYQPGDLIWVHDYQLMLVPRMLRERLPDARIGFFLHIPFPSSEVVRALPQREQILEGLLGADLLGFHTAAFQRHFTSSALRIVGAQIDVDHVRWDGREVKLGVFPMGVDAVRFGEIADSQRVSELVREHRADGAQILVGVDRLDYTKGIPRRLLAFEKLLNDHPELRGKVRLVQVAVPSRDQVEAYSEHREEVDAVVGRIHGAFSTPTWTPVHYLHRSLAAEEVVALYRAADAVLVTPLRDGMNLVAKEFVASRTDGDGVLVLSEFAGAAAELGEAVRVNPYDVDAMAEALYRALAMGEDERRGRMEVLRERVSDFDVHRWARTYVAQLSKAGRAENASRPSPAAEVEAALRRAAEADTLILLLDYDGTLVPFARTPELAAPDRALLELVGALSALRRTRVHLVSGRRRETLERWFGRFAVGLHAEHGFWSRMPGGEWRGAETGDDRWREPVLGILRDFTDRTPGTLIERKTAGFAWHYRAADPEYGELQARELSFHLGSVLRNSPVEVLEGDKVIEVRLHGINKGRAVERVLDDAPEGALLLAMGDDRTDEDLFAALPEGAIAVHVGPSDSRAPLRIPDVRAARTLLGAIVRSRDPA